MEEKIIQAGKQQATMCRIEIMVFHLDAQLGKSIQSILHALCEQTALNAMNPGGERSLTVPIAGRYNRCCFIPTPRESPCHRTKRRFPRADSLGSGDIKSWRP